MATERHINPFALPDRDTFRELSGKGNLIPVYKEVLADLLTPVSAYLKLAAGQKDRRPSFLFESVAGGEKWARYSFIGLRPSAVLTARGNQVRLERGRSVRALDARDPVQAAEDFMRKFTPAGAEDVLGLPRFYGGLVGYIGYDMVRFMEELPDKNRVPFGMPDMFLMLTDTMLIFDNFRQSVKVLANVHLRAGADPGKAYDSAVKKIDAVIKRLNSPLRQGPGGPDGAGGGEPALFSSAFGPRQTYEAAVEKAKEYITAGDIIQVVLSQRFERRSPVKDPFGIYRALRLINPSPYMYYIDTGEASLIGSSPEILVRLDGGDITLRPIAGTRRRGATPEEDLSLEAELKADPKEIAEHIMLVDLGRNDVGRVAVTGSVHVTDLMTVDRYSHVMHMVSNVEGRLKPGLNAFDVLRATFPAGTVTGAPKIRAMQIIEELEPTRRGPYAGSVGYISYSGNMDMCITIRTLLARQGMVYVQAGGGLVADSVPENEYMETRNKARALMEAVDLAESVFGAEESAVETGKK